MIGHTYRRPVERVGIPPGYPSGNVQLRREHSNPWPCVVLVCVLVLCGTAFALKGLASDPPPRAIAAPAPLEVTRVVTVTATPTPVATQTARVLVYTPTGTPTPVLPFCEDVTKAGTICVALPMPRTATSVPDCPNHPTYEFVCVKPDEGTASEGETE